MAKYSISSLMFHPMLEFPFPLIPGAAETGILLLE
jgi:hypothetical protein